MKKEKKSYSNSNHMPVLRKLRNFAMKINEIHKFMKHLIKKTETPK